MSDITTQILIDIRDEIRTTNSRLDGTNTRLDGTNARLDGHEKLLEQLVETANRHEHALADLASLARRQEQALVQVVDAVERHDKALVKLVHGVDSLNERFDNFLTGTHRTTHEEMSRRYDELDARLTKVERKQRRQA